KALRRGPFVFRLEPPLLRRGGRLRRAPGAAGPGRLPELFDDPLGRELAVPELGALVLGDRADDRAEAVEDAPDLRRRQALPGLDVEQGLHARRALLRVLASRAARAREA